MIHKQEMPGRTASDAMDRDNIRHKLEMCIDPLSCEDHPEGIVTIVTGRIAPAAVNADNAAAVGKQQMKQFEAGCPESFYDPLSKKAVTMSINRKHIKLGSAYCF